MKEKLQRVIDSFMPGAELLKYEPLMGGVSSEVFLLEIKKDAQLKKIVLIGERLKCNLPTLILYPFLI